MHSFDEALNLVIDFIREHGYRSNIVILHIQRIGHYTGVTLLKPYGLFIVNKAGLVEDNYQTFSKEEGHD